MDTDRKTAVDAPGVIRAALIELLQADGARAGLHYVCCGGDEIKGERGGVRRGGVRNVVKHGGLCSRQLVHVVEVSVEVR